MKEKKKILIKDNMNKIKAGEQIESKKEEYSYEEILDLEFKLVQNESKPPINKNTKIRSDRDSQAGGKHDPTFGFDTVCGY